jgi:hypothetical protein
MLHVLAFLGCSSSPVQEGWTNGETHYIVFETEPTTIPFNEYFKVFVSVYTDETKDVSTQDINVLVDALMPEHDHGMNETPSISLSEDGRFRAEGLKWFMTGLWDLEIYVTDEDGFTENAIFPIECCDE